MAAISQARVVRLLLSSFTAPTTQEQGRIFEDLVCYLFSKVPGISITERNTLNPYHSEEIDVVAWNEKDRRGFNFLPNTIVIEAKNWSTPVGASALTEFAYKLEVRSQTFGFFIALNGVTGTPEEITAARDRIRTALMKGIHVIVIEGSDLASFHSGEDFVRFVKVQLCRIAAAGTQF